MSHLSTFYLDRVADEQAKAENSTLANVRDSHLRAAAAWDALATRSLRSDRLREAEERRKAELA
jgi:hypothetical protein